MWEILQGVSVGAVWAAAGGSEGADGNCYLALSPLL